MYYNMVLKRVHCNHCYLGKAVSITYSECVFIALRIQHAMPMVIMLFMACPALRYFIFHNIS